MIRRLSARLVRAAVALVAVCAFVGLAVELMPGDAAEIRAGSYATPEDIERIRAEQGLDRLAIVRWFAWAAGALHGDLGASAVSGRPVSEMIAQRLPITATLAGLAVLIAIPLAAAATVPAARAAARGRRTAGVGLTAAVAIPQVVVAVGLIALYAGVLGWFPAVSFLAPGVPPLAQPDRLVLPVATLALPSAAFAAVLIRGAAVDAITSPHVRDARLRGVPRVTVAMRYLARPLAAPIVQVSAVVGGSLIAGTALVEAVFGISGLGEMLVTGVATRDVAVVQAIAMLGAIAVLAGLLVADLLGDITAYRRERGAS